MKLIIIRVALLAVILLTAASPVAAGGWATVRLDEAPGSIFAGEPWQFGFMVRQHDITPNSDVNAVVRAVHMETGEKVTAEGLQIGPVGHFEARIRFPVAGEWKWEIAPEPFGATSLETLSVLPGKEGVATTSKSVNIARSERAAAPSSGSASPDVVEVTITDMGFSPSRIEIAPGTEVIWTNTASIAHGVMSDSLEFRDSGLLDRGDAFRQVLTAPNTLAFGVTPVPR